MGVSRKLRNRLLTNKRAEIGKEAGLPQGNALALRETTETSTKTNLQIFHEQLWGSGWKKWPKWLIDKATKIGAGSTLTILLYAFFCELPNLDIIDVFWPLAPYLLVLGLVGKGATFLWTAVAWVKRGAIAGLQARKWLNEQDGASLALLLAKEAGASEQKQLTEDKDGDADESESDDEL